MCVYVVREHSWLCVSQTLINTQVHKTHAKSQFAVNNSFLIPT